MDIAAAIRDATDRFMRAVYERKETLAICAMVDALPSCWWRESPSRGDRTSCELMSGQNVVGVVTYGPEPGTTQFTVSSAYWGA